MTARLDELLIVLFSRKQFHFGFTAASRRHAAEFAQHMRDEFLHENAQSAKIISSSFHVTRSFSHSSTPVCLSVCLSSSRNVLLNVRTRRLFLSRSAFSMKTMQVSPDCVCNSILRSTRQRSGTLYAERESMGFERAGSFGNRRRSVSGMMVNKDALPPCFSSLCDVVVLLRAAPRTSLILSDKVCEFRRDRRLVTSFQHEWRDAS